MLTANEIIFLKELIDQLASAADPSEYTEREIQEAMELLNRIEPIETEKFLDFMDNIETHEEEAVT